MNISLEHTIQITLDEALEQIEENPDIKNWIVRSPTRTADALFRYISQGRTLDVVGLLEAGADPNACDHDRNTPLMFAAGNGHIKMVRALVDAGADVNARMRLGMTALMAAAALDHPEVVSLLADSGAVVDATQKHGWTALMFATDRSHHEVVRVLITYGASVNAQGEAGGKTRVVTPLIVAASNKDTQMLRLLLENGAEPNPEGLKVTALHEAAALGDLDSATVLLDHGADIDATEANGDSALNLSLASACSTREMAHVLLSQGARIDNGAVRPLVVACYIGRSDVVIPMLDKGADINELDPKFGFTALTAAVCGEKADIVRLLVERGADVNHSSRGKAPIKYAARNGDIEIAEELLKAGADPNVGCSGNRETALSIAKGSNDEAMLNLLKSYGAQDPDEETERRSLINQRILNSVASGLAFRIGRRKIGHFSTTSDVNRLRLVLCFDL